MECDIFHLSPRDWLNLSNKPRMRDVLGILTRQGTTLTIMAMWIIALEQGIRVWSQLRRALRTLRFCGIMSVSPSI